MNLSKPVGQGYRWAGSPQCQTGIAVKKRDEDVDRPVFATELKARFEQLNLSLTAVGKRMGVPSPTLRQWLKRNRYPIDALVDLARRAGLPTDVEELKAQYHVEIVRPKRTAERISAKPPKDLTVREALQVIEQRLERIDPSGRAQEDLSSDVNLFLHALNPEDKFIFWSLDDVAFEMTVEGWQAIGSAIASRIYDGTDFIYIYPDEQILRELRTSCGLRKLPTAESFETAFEAFVDNLKVAELKNLETGEIRKDAATGQRLFLHEAHIREHVISVKAKAAAFTSPGHKYVLFLSAGTARAAAHFPTGGATKKRSLLPLEQDAANQLRDFINACLKAPGDHRNNDVIRKLAPAEQPVRK